MKILICIKQVPDTATKIKISENKKTIEQTSIKYEINPYDEYAIEEALRLKENNPNTTITVISLGPERVKQSLTKIIAIGADNAIHLKTNENIKNSFVVAKILANEIKKKNYDLILFGKKSVDQDNNQIGIMIGEINQIPCISNCTEFKINNNTITAHREIEGAIQIFESKLPIIITQEKGKNELRYPSLRNLMAAKKKTIESIDIVEQINDDIELIKLEYPPVRKEGKIIGEGKEAVSELVRILREEKKII